MLDVNRGCVLPKLLTNSHIKDKGEKDKESIKTKKKTKYQNFTLS